MWRGTGRVRVLRPERRVARFGWPSRGMTERPSPPKCRLGIMPQALAAAAGCPCSPTARELSVRCIARATENVHRDMYVLASVDHGMTFEGRKLHTWDINACPMSSMAFSEGAGGVVGAWETGGQVYFEQLAKVNETPVSAPGAANGRKHPRVAIGPNGTSCLYGRKAQVGKRVDHWRGSSLTQTGRPMAEGHCSGSPILEFRRGSGKADGGFLVLY